MTSIICSKQPSKLNVLVTTVLLAVTFVLPTSAAAQQLPDVANLFDAQKASVVSIQTETAATQRGFFRTPDSGTRMGQGSGFVVDAEGFILTNNHVIDGAQKIMVGFENGEKYTATLVGTDASSDIALIKIKPPHALKAVTLGSNSSLKVGHWVVAIGNPYGLNYSVTAGIISAKGRNIGAGPYDDFLQTDASINPGNSGGPLFDMQGRVVGMNTAIIKDGQGIGFAVPVDTIKSVIPQLKDKGYVVRGFIGASIQALDEDLAKSFGLPSDFGVLIGSISPGGPAAIAGVRPGDIATAFEGKRVHDVQAFLVAVADARPGLPVEMKVVRDSKEIGIILKVDERPDPRRNNVQITEKSEPAPPGRLGIQVRSLTKETAFQLGATTQKGVIVERVAINGLAAQFLKPGDVILEVDGNEVGTPDELGRAISGAKRQVIRLLVLRDQRTTFVAFKAT